MTTTDPTDARASAWICAFDTIRAAQKLKLNKHKRAVEQLPELYWSLMAEAAIFADLARADFQTGLAAGTHLVARDARIRENRDRMSRVVAEAKAAQRHPHRAAADAFQSRTSALDGTTETDHAGHRCSFDRNASAVPIGAIHVVRVMRGDWAGRTGSVIAVYQDNEPPMVDVALEPRSLVERPELLTATFHIDRGSGGRSVLPALSATVLHGLALRARKMVDA